MKIIIQMDTQYACSRNPVKTKNQEFCNEKYKETWGEYHQGWVRVKIKTMETLFKENPNAFFDKYGNLCFENDHLAPFHFCYLGQVIDLPIGCGMDNQLYREEYL